MSSKMTAINIESLSLILIFLSASKFKPYRELARQPSTAPKITGIIPPIIQQTPKQT